MDRFSAARQMMVDCQVRPSDVTRYAIIEAMLWAPRERFVPKSRADIAYSEAEIPVGDASVLMPARTFAKMLELAAVEPGDLVLDLAPGSGYSTAVLSRLAAVVVSVERDPALIKVAQSAMEELDLNNVVVLEGDPAAGDPRHGPFDVIMINGAVERIPDAVVDQLKDGGRLIAIYCEESRSQCRLFIKSGTTMSSRYAFDASAPLVPGFKAETTFVFEA